MLRSFYGSLRRKPARTPQRSPDPARAGLCCCALALGARAGARGRQPGRAAGRSRPPARARRPRGRRLRLRPHRPNRRCSPSAPPTLRPPASVEKLYTATTALERMGAERAPEHDRVRRRPARARRRLGRQPLSARRRRPDVRLAARSSTRTTAASARRSRRSSRQLVRTDGIHRVTGSIYGDESWFDSCRGEPSSDYAPDPFLEGTLSGARVQPRRKRRDERGTARAGRLRRARAAGGAEERRREHRAATAARRRTPAGASQLAQVQSPTVAQLLGLMLPPSDNFFAETLVKDLGAPLRRRRHDRGGRGGRAPDDRLAARPPPAGGRRLGALRSGQNLAV